MLTFTQFLIEGKGFELGGKKYSSGFGRYTCNGEKITREEYMRASEQYKNGNIQKTSTNQNHEPNKLKSFNNDLHKTVIEFKQLSTEVKNKYNKIKEIVPYASQTGIKLENIVGCIIKDNMSWMNQLKSDTENIQKILSNEIDKSSGFYKKIESLDKNNIFNACERYLNDLEKSRNRLYAETKQLKQEFDVIYKKYEHLV
jgi:hypothetical protein